MNPTLFTWGRGAPAALCLLAWALWLPSLHAYPPAPNYIIYGTVRDQVGATLAVDGAEIILLRNDVEIDRAPIFNGLRLGSNYELNLSIDQTRFGTRTYSSKAVAPQGLYSLKVTLNGQDFYPIEANGTLRAGNGGERVRLDLNLGLDANHDGLPDAWQEWVLYQAGRRPGTPGWDINLVTKDGDFSGDGVSNWIKYVAGTYNGDATQRFELRLTDKTATLVSFQFYAITGKAYGIEESTDLKTWAPVPFSTTAGGTATALYKAPAVGVVPAYVTAQPGESRFYRLTVR